MILDAFAVVAYLLNEPAAAEVELMLAAPPAERSLTGVGVAEVVDRLVRGAGHAEEEVLADLTELGLLADAVATTGTIGAAAGCLRARHYHRRTCAVSHADCVTAETARHTGRPLVTADPHLRDVCAAEGISVLTLPTAAA